MGWPQLTNSTQINSVSADELGPPVALFSPTRPSVRMQNFESRIGAIYSLPYITDTLYYVNVKLFVDQAFSLDINKRHFVFTKVFSKPHWPHIILLDLGVASWIKVLSVRFQLLSLRLQLILHHLLNKYRDPIKHQPRREKPAENTSVAQLSPSLLSYYCQQYLIGLFKWFL